MQFRHIYMPVEDEEAAYEQLGYVPDDEHTDGDRCRCGKPKDGQLPYCSAECFELYEGPFEEAL